MLAAAKTSEDAQTSNNVFNPSTTSSPADWTEFHRDNMQRWNPNETILGVGNVAGLQLKWKSNIGGGANPTFFLLSSPAVVNGVVYYGSDDGNVYALNASTGAKLWSFATRNKVESSPAVVNGVVYVGSEDGNVYALNASTGAKLWSFATGSSVDSSPAVVNGVVYVGSGIDVLALNASTGAKLWSFAVTGGVLSSPAVVNGVVYFGANGFTVYAVNASTGTLLWSFAENPEDAFVSSPAVANGVVYIGSLNPNVYALNASTGSRLWLFGPQSSVYSSPAVASGVVYIGSDDGNVYALSASTGAKLWSYFAGGVRSSPAVANGVVYFGTVDGNAYALNASTGAKLWSFTTGGGLTSSPTIVDGVVYIRVGDQSGGNLYAFSVGADLFLRIFPSTTVHQGDLLTFAFPVWNLGPSNAVHEVLNTQVPAGTVIEYIRISGTPGLGTCATPPYHGTGQIVCHENSSMAPNTTWTVRLTVKVTAPAGTVITANAATMADTLDPHLANNMATVSIKVQ
jgi:outer membrane protein assembly factor BamB